MSVLVKRTQFDKVRTLNKSRPYRALNKHIKYILDQKENQRNKVEPFGKFDHEKPTRKGFMKKLREQKQHGVIAHRLIFSLSEEERNNYNVDLKELVRDSLEQYEARWKTKLDWIGAIHDVEGHPHAHIVIRGRDELDRSVYINTDRMQQMARYAERSKERQRDRVKEPEPDFLLELERERQKHPVELERDRERDWDLDR